MKLVIGGIKGGTGKTTLAVNLAVVSSFLKRKILLVDADDQRSTSHWADQREKATFPTISLLGKNIYQQIEEFQSNYDDIIIDTGGRDTTSQRSALAIADKFLIPFKPRSFDIWTLGRVKQLIEEIQLINPKLECFYVINQGDAKGDDNLEAMEIINEMTMFKPIPVAIGHRKSFCNAATDGKSVFEMEKKDEKACDELWKLASFLYYNNIVSKPF